MQLRGLKARKDLNGEVGIVTAPLNKKGRHNTQLISGKAKLKKMGVKPQNLLLLKTKGTTMAREQCGHYRRTCGLVCPDCQEVHTCRMCHDDKWEMCT